MFIRALFIFSVHNLHINPSVPRVDINYFIFNSHKHLIHKENKQLISLQLTQSNGHCSQPNEASLPHMSILRYSKLRAQNLQQLLDLASIAHRHKVTNLQNNFC